MSDIYGTGIPSSIARPAGAVGGEFVPAPGLPPNYPHYLKPIPVNTRDLSAEFISYLRANEPRVMRILYSTWNADRNAIKYQEIRNALRDGEFSSQFLDRFRQSYSRLITDKFEPMWQKTWQQSGEILTGRGFAFDKFQINVTEYARRFLEEHGGNLAVRLTQEQHAALRTLLRHFIIEEPLSAVEVAQSIRGVIGLTQKEASMYAKARSAWLQEGLTRKEMEHLAGNYWGRLHRRRALRIARTEQSFAYNYGQMDAMKQAQKANIFGRGSIIYKIWDASASGNCEFCSGLNGVRVGMEGTYPNLSMGNSWVPPAHPNCQCVIIYQIVQDARYAI